MKNYHSKKQQKQLPEENILLVILLMFLVVLPMIATDIYLPSIPSIEAAFLTSHSSIMLTLTVYMMGYSSSLIFSGVLSDRYGRRPIILAGTLIFTASSIACIYTNSIATLITLRFFQAFGGGCGTLLARVVVRDAFDSNNQVRVLSYLSAGLALSPTLGPILGGFLVVNMDWRAPFIFVSSFGGIVFLLSLFFLKETLPSTTTHGQTLLTLSQLLHIIRNREFLAYTLVISLAWSIYFSFIASSSLLLQKKFNLEPITYGFSFSILISGYILGTIFTRKKIKNNSINYLIQKASYVILAGTLTTFLIALLDNSYPLILLITIAVSLAGVGVIFPTTQAGVMKPFSVNYGLVASLFYAIEMLFGAITGVILGYFKSENPIVMASIMFFSASLIFLIVKYMLCGDEVIPHSDIS